MDDITVVKLDTKQAQTSLKELRNQLKALKDEMAGLEEGSDEFLEIANKAGTLKHQIDEISESVKGASADFGDMLGNVTKVMTGIIGGIQSAKGAMTLFGVESENVTKAIEKMQASMAIIQGLTSIDTGIKALAKLQKAITGTTVVAKALRAALTPKAILALTVAVTALITIIDKLKNKQEEAAKASKERFDNEVKYNEELINSYKKVFDEIQALSNKNINALNASYQLAKYQFEKIASETYNMSKKQISAIEEYMKAYYENLTNASNAATEEEAANAIMSANAYKQLIDKKIGNNKDLYNAYQSMYDILNKINILEKNNNKFNILEKNNSTSSSTSSRRTDAPGIDYYSEYIQNLDDTVEKLKYCNNVINECYNNINKLIDEGKENTNDWWITQIRLNKAIIQSSEIYSNIVKNELKSGFTSLDDMLDKVLLLNDEILKMHTHTFTIDDNNNKIWKEREKALEKESVEYKTLVALQKEIGNTFISYLYQTSILDGTIKSISDELMFQRTILTEMCVLEDEKNGKTEEYLRYQVSIKKIEDELYNIGLERKQIAAEMEMISSSNYTGYVEEIKFNNTIIDIEKEKLSTLKEGTIEYEKQALLIQDLQNKNRQLSNEMSIHYTNVAATVLNDLGSALNSIADYQENLINQELEAGKISEEEAQRKFEENKKLAYAGTVINGLMGIVNAWSSAMSPFNSYLTIWGQLALGLSSTVASAALMAVQLQQIKSQTLSTSGGNTSTPSSSAVNATIIPPLQYSAAVQGASTEQAISNNKNYVSVVEIERVSKRVNVAESEAYY